ncbi:MAG: hypothetical protein C4520_15595 [Candidatus Abyssobacteria bacterium SURF_5]|uniref:Uncharacterized protein n=1 Tax=Abyssobacteria bacterium (strain SURF_5) TaxID=2093360 RepID=A0A3A4NEJ8_ABYX5|nr:MAG: hypothetical protein C4520_15595 [Candidatus Abyssubacteria bacterium SURF_5]
MTHGGPVQCGCCGALVAPEVPQYFFEIECFRLLAERNREIPRRGSREYHEAMEELRPEITTSYYHNAELYRNGHLWCPVCGSRLTPSKEE